VKKIIPIHKSEKKSWDHVSHWYDALLSGDDTYQLRVILPNILRVMNIKKGERILDCACGQGFFTRAFFKEGAIAIGVDSGQELIAIAKKESPKEIKFLISNAEKLSCFVNTTFDKVVIILAAQNIQNLRSVFMECARVLVPGGKLYVVINHPAFRVPQSSDWGYDEKKKVQYRRTEHYLTEFKVSIEMNPGRKIGVSSVVTSSFHRPLQYFFKALTNSGFLISNLEEWVSHKESQHGPHKIAEDCARKEIPLFMMMEGVKM